ncbi:hypothetical protein, partial [Teichococcus wenyumeiae]|uniref:hypothetical protein n=1 Tax=Teichococcus wenyumeiae TaxID=2478470 RepID=UPI001F2581A0
GTEANLSVTLVGRNRYSWASMPILKEDELDAEARKALIFVARGIAREAAAADLGLAEPKADA